MKVTVICVAYNHEKFIRQTLDGLVSQKTNFSYEILIGDDASTDDTAGIIREYVKEFPDKITAILHEKNIGAASNCMDLYNRVRSEYVAVCDGDDYWTDEYKLQKQIDFLDAHQDHDICFTAMKVITDGSDESTILPNEYFKKFYNLRDSIDAGDLLIYNFITCPVTTVWRWKFNDGLPEWYTGDVWPLDLFMHLIHARDGKIGFIDEITGVYRKHGGGMWNFSSGADQYHDIHRKYWHHFLERTRVINDYYAGKYPEAMKWHISTLMFNIRKMCYRDNDIDTYINAIREYKDLFFMRESLDFDNASNLTGATRLLKFHHLD